MTRSGTFHVGVALVLGLVSALVLARQLGAPGLYCCITDDSDLYLSWTRQFEDALRDGILQPRWVEGAHEGFGSPSFLFYAPLSHYLTATFQLGGVDVGLASTLTKLVGLWLSALGMYAFGVDAWGPRAAFVAAVATVVLPFRVYDVYVLGVFQSKLALGFVPLLFLGARRLAEDRRGTVLVALSFAGLVLTHLLSGYMGALTVLPYALVVAPRGARARTALKLALGMALGLLLASFYVLPVAVESSLVHLEAFREKAWGRYENNFLFWLGTTPSAANPPFYGYLRQTVLVSLLAGIGVWVAGMPWRTREGWRESRALLASAVLLTFLLTVASAPLWRFVPGLAMVLFPTRFAGFLVLVLAALMGIGAGRIQTGPGWTVVAACGALVAIQDGAIATKACVQTEADLAELTTIADVEEYVPRAVPLSWLRALDVGSVPPLVSQLDGGAVRADVLSSTAEDRLLRIDAPAGGAIAVRLFAFPGWRAAVDGTPVATRVDPRTGAFVFDLSPGAHDVRLHFGTTWDRTLGRVTSLVSWLAFGAFLLRRSANP
jgi:hypothetical protein